MTYICDESVLKLNVPFKANLDDWPIIICKTTKGIFALEDRCSHEDYPLSEGNIEDESITCIRHGSVFKLDTGKPIVLPALLPVKTYKVLVEEGKIYINE